MIIRASLVAQIVKCLPVMRRPGFSPWVGKIPWRRKWQPTPVLLPGKFHGLRSLVGYSPWGCYRVGHDWATSLSLSFIYDYTVEVRNRFKGLDLIDRVPDELWTEVRDIVPETGIKIIPEKKKWKKAKWLSEKALKIAVKRKEAKSKGEKEKYSHLNAEFQRKRNIKKQNGCLRRP